MAFPKFFKESEIEEVGGELMSAWSTTEKGPLTIYKTLTTYVTGEVVKTKALIYGDFIHVAYSGSMGLKSLVSVYVAASMKSGLPKAYLCDYMGDREALAIVIKLAGPLASSFERRVRPVREVSIEAVEAAAYEYFRRTRPPKQA